MSKARGLRGRFGQRFLDFWRQHRRGFNGLRDLCQLLKNRLTGIADLGRKADRNARALEAIPEGLQAVPEWIQWLKAREQGLGSVRSVERPIEAANSHCRIDESGRGGGGNCAADHSLDGRDSRAWNEPEIQIERACEFDQAGQADIAPAALDLRNVALKHANARPRSRWPRPLASRASFSPLRISSVV